MPPRDRSVPRRRNSRQHHRAAHGKPRRNRLALLHRGLDESGDQSAHRREQRIGRGQPRARGAADGRRIGRKICRASRVRCGEGNQQRERARNDKRNIVPGNRQRAVAAKSPCRGPRTVAKISARMPAVMCTTAAPPRSTKPCPRPNSRPSSASQPPPQTQFA